MYLSKFIERTTQNEPYCKLWALVQHWLTNCNKHTTLNQDINGVRGTQSINVGRKNSLYFPLNFSTNTKLLKQ